MSSNAPNPPLPETLAELIRYNRERFGEYVSLIYESPGQERTYTKSGGGPRGKQTGERPDASGSEESVFGRSTVNRSRGEKHERPLDLVLVR